MAIVNMSESLILQYQCDKYLDRQVEAVRWHKEGRLIIPYMQGEDFLIGLKASGLSVQFVERSHLLDEQ